ncbi:chromate resistance protein ChrB domain-containing protein [Desulfobacter latus]|uniref:Chromate resistance protein n=1 Tax=Desulfobacter latus TaxID=2292 RepID=A0A850SW82_9BACT|nr:chromate resistance protein ChrB domain-containing protein [Desulfobacter latus]NWH05409.1 chromate resistance protein [Desulfobacter latus]
MMNKIMLILIFVLCSAPDISISGTFATWEGLEPDKLASIWLIQKFISQDSDIVFYPHGTKINSGIVFDTPYSKIRRRYNQSSFEALMDHYRITDPKLDTMAKLIHDMEINIWEHKRFKLTHDLELFFITLLDTVKEREKIIQKASAYFDALYKRLPAGLVPTAPPSSLGP